MKQKWIKWLIGILFTPILFFVILMATLYIPSVQNFLRQKATEYASSATGMDISIQRIDLRFPLNLLIRGVEVIQQPDTLLSLESLNVHVQAKPLFKGQVEIDDITLKNVTVNSANLIEGMHLKGKLGRFFIESHGVDLLKESVIINKSELSDTHLLLQINDSTTAPADSTVSSPIHWKIALHQLDLANISFKMQLPTDSLEMDTHVGKATIKDAVADLGSQQYSLQHFLLSETSVGYDSGHTNIATEGFDPSHINVHDIAIDLDSLLYNGREMNAIIRNISLNEQSGLSVTSFTGQLISNDSLIRIPNLKLQTPHSEIALSAQTYWELITIPTSGRLSASLDAQIGKEDVLLFAGNLSQDFKAAYPNQSLRLHARTDGNLKQMQISGFKVELPGSFSAEGGGLIANVTDSIMRTGTVGLKMHTENLNFLKSLGGNISDSLLVIPDSMSMLAKMELQGSQYNANVQLDNRGGSVKADASINMSTENYMVDLQIDSLQLQHFLPKDSLYELSLATRIEGHGLDVMSNTAYAKLALDIEKLHYARYQLSDIHLNGNLKRGVLTAELTSNNSLLKMAANAEYNLKHSYPEGKAMIEVKQLNLNELGILSEPMKEPLTFNLEAEARQNRLFTHFTSGDLKLNLSTRCGVNELIAQSTYFLNTLNKQIETRTLDHAKLRQTLPPAILSFSAGKENPLAYYLETQNISYDNISMKFATDPDWGINGKMAIHTMKMDTLQLDTIFFNMAQDTTKMKLQGGVINGAKNPQFSFTSSFTGEIRDKDAELILEYKNKQGDTGILLGMNFRPLLRGESQGGGGLALSLVPQEPIIAFRKFHFKEDHNKIYLHNNMRVYANVDMLDEEGMGFRIHSLAEDTVSLQNIDVQVQGIRLEEISSVLPYFPAITGLFSAKAHYIQTEKDLQLSAEASIDELTYERRRIGDIALGGTWLPETPNKQYLSAYLHHEGKEVLEAKGNISTTEEKESLFNISTSLKHFPLSIGNAFIPEGIITLFGNLNGELNITGNAEQPLINGQLSLDSTAIFSHQYGVRFFFDQRPIKLENNRLTFDQFSIYTTEKNPFTIDGYVDFRNINLPEANLTMQARNYTLLDAKRTRERVVYGKLLADIMATIKGPLDGLMMRGNINLLGGTDLSYVLTDSPLTVQDRLNSLVTFTSFQDTTNVVRQEVPTVSLGGIDMIMMVHIDPSVRMKVDLDINTDDRIELEGGGDLSLKYTPQGDMTLTGRYTLTGGLMKYALPVIAAKEFTIDNGSYVEWTGKLMDPTLNFKASDRIRASVSDGDNGTRMVNFDVSVIVKNRLDHLEVAFDVAAPEDATIENELTAMGAEERGKQALYIMVAKTYLGTGTIGDGDGFGNLNMGTALNSVLSSQINSLMGNLKNASVSVGIEDHDVTDTGGKRTDYSFRYSQRFFNDRFQIVIGGKVSTGENATNNAESFIDNISLEYRLDRTGTRYIRLFYDKNYESVLEGEITETGVGLVLRKKLNKLSELFIFKRKEEEKENEVPQK